MNRLLLNKPKKQINKKDKLDFYNIKYEYIENIITNNNIQEIYFSSNFKDKKLFDKFKFKENSDSTTNKLICGFEEYQDIRVFFRYTKYCWIYINNINFKLSKQIIEILKNTTLGGVFTSDYNTFKFLKEKKINIQFAKFFNNNSENLKNYMIIKNNTKNIKNNFLHNNLDSKYHFNNTNFNKLIWAQKLNIKNIFLINLDHEIDKLLLMKYKLANINIPFNYITRIKGIFGNKDIKCLEFYDSIKYNSDNNINSVSAVGILFTFKKLFNSINLNQNLNNKYLFLEDDICFHKNFNDKINYFINNFNTNTYDIIYLGANTPKISESMLNDINYKTIINYDYNNWIYGMYGVILNVKTIQLLKKELEKNIFSPIDNILTNIIRKYKLKTIILNPNLIIPIVTYSLNMGKRDQNTFLKNIRQNKDDYIDVDFSTEFIDIYQKYSKNKLNLNGKLRVSIHKTNTEIKKILKDNFFYIIITSFNHEKWVYKNLISVINQTYTNWKILYYNDNSEDNTFQKVQDFIKKFNIYDKIEVINSKKRYYQAYGRWQCYQKISNDNDICVLLDGDDWFYDENVLQKLNELYKSKDINVSYGDYHMLYNNKMTKVNCKDFPESIIINKTYRKYEWISQHMRTGKAGLFKSIPLNYLRDEKGEYIKCVSDWAEMFWILEKSNGKHCNNGFNCYVYNKDASLGYINSYYNRDKDKKWKEYRIKLEKKYRNY